MSLFQKDVTRHIREFKPDVSKFNSVVLQQEVILAELKKKCTVPSPLSVVSSVAIHTD